MAKPARKDRKLQTAIVISKTMEQKKKEEKEKQKRKPGVPGRNNNF